MFFGNVPVPAVLAKSEPQQHNLLPARSRPLRVIVTYMSDSVVNREDDSLSSSRVIYAIEGSMKGDAVGNVKATHREDQAKVGAGIQQRRSCSAWVIRKSLISSLRKVMASSASGSSRTSSSRYSPLLGSLNSGP